jgi:hypothetical protein
MPAGAVGGGGAPGAGAGGDAGLTDAEKKKKIKKARTDEGEFVCRDCGTVDSPEWRRGPLGPKTLCNAVSIPLFRNMFCVKHEKVNIRLMTIGNATMTVRT